MTAIFLPIVHEKNHTARALKNIEWGSPLIFLSPHSNDKMSTPSEMANLFGMRVKYCNCFNRRLVVASVFITANCLKKRRNRTIRRKEWRSPSRGAFNTAIKDLRSYNSDFIVEWTRKRLRNYWKKFVHIQYYWNKKTRVMRPCISPEIKSIIQRCIQIKYIIVLLKYDFAGPGSHRTNNRRVHIDGIYISFFYLK